MTFVLPRTCASKGLGRNWHSRLGQGGRSRVSLRLTSVYHGQDERSLSKSGLLGSSAAGFYKRRMTFNKEKKDLNESEAGRGHFSPAFIHYAVPGAIRNQTTALLITHLHLRSRLSLLVPLYSSISALSVRISLYASFRVNLATQTAHSASASACLNSDFARDRPAPCSRSRFAAAACSRISCSASAASASLARKLSRLSKKLLALLLHLCQRISIIIWISAHRTGQVPHKPRSHAGLVKAVTACELINHHAVLLEVVPAHATGAVKVDPRAMSWSPPEFQRH